MFGLASLGQQNPFSGFGGSSLGTNQNTQQLSALTPQSLMMGSVPSYLQTAGALGNTALSPLAMILSGLGVH